MLDYATMALAISISALVIVLAFCFLPISVEEGSLADSALSAMMGAFWLSVCVMQLLLAYGLQDAQIAAWRVVGLYLTSITVFLAGIPLGIELLRETTKVSLAPRFDDRLINVSLIAYAVGWISEVCLLLLR